MYMLCVSGIVVLVTDQIVPKDWKLGKLLGTGAFGQVQ